MSVQDLNKLATSQAKVEKLDTALQKETLVWAGTTAGNKL
jgi:hypothetical protein